MNDGLGPEGSYYEKKAREEKAQKDAAYPAMVTALYLVLGFVFGLWHPGWLIFLTIPLHYRSYRSRWEQLADPVMITLIYLVLGFFFNLWHPGWLVFILLPMLSATKK